jgi:ribosomal protein L11 methyltransferase
MNWYAIDVTVTPAAREAVEYALMEAGALGTEERRNGAGAVCVAGYFESEPKIESVRAALMDALRIYGLATPDVREMRLREVADEDWLAEWKKGWQPVGVGRFVIAPPWVEPHAEPGRIVICIEPGMAFGTGTHETTRLCLAAVGRHFKGGSFLDVGTGTGILAIAAALLRPEAIVEACDTDPIALTIAHENAMLNGVAERVNFRVGTINEDTASADCVTANLTADVILPLLPTLLDATCGHLILSGILVTQVAAVTTRLRELGTANYEVMSDGEWAAITI